MDHTRKSSIFSCYYNMKPSPSELALEELFKELRGSQVVNKIEQNDNQFLGGCDSNGYFVFENDGRISHHEDDISFSMNQEMINGLSNSDATNFWSRNLTPKNSNTTVTSDSQSSIYVGSPTSTIIKPQGGNQASSGSSDDDDDNGTDEAGSCEQSDITFHIKRIKRKESNRESARRSRRRKQAYVAELEQQAEKLRGEGALLLKQLTNAMQQFKEATTNNRVLNSEVEALRAKVKLAEDMVARGSLTSSLSHLLKNYLNTPNHISNSTITTFHGGSSFGLENLEPFNGGLNNNGAIRDSVSSVSEINIF